MKEILLIGSDDGQYAGEDDFSEWVDTHQESLTLYCRYLTGSDWEGQDLLQEMWLKVWTAKNQNRKLKINRSYLRRTAYHAWIDRCRKPPVPFSGSQCDILLEHIKQPEGLDAAVLFAAFENLIQHFPVNQRAALLLMEVYRFSATEAAQMVKTSKGAVKASLHRARQKLKRMQLEEERRNLNLEAGMKRDVTNADFANVYVGNRNDEVYGNTKEDVYTDNKKDVHMNTKEDVFTDNKGDVHMNIKVAHYNDLNVDVSTDSRADNCTGNDPELYSDAEANRDHAVNADAEVVAAYFKAFQSHDIPALTALFNGEEQRSAPVMQKAGRHWMNGQDHRADCRASSDLQCAA